MNAENFALALFMLFLAYHWLVTQKLFLSKSFLLLSVIIILICLLSFVFLNSKYTESKQPHYLLLLIVYHAITLIVYKYTYSAINNFLVKKNWIKPEFANKEFTFIVVSDTGDIWDKKRSLRPTWLDRILSFVLFFLPGVLMLLTFECLN
jgi:hypothetical protein